MEWRESGLDNLKMLVDFLPSGKTINAERNYEILRKFQRAVQNKRRGRIGRGIMLFYNNARPHSTGVSQNHIEQFGLGTVRSPAVHPLPPAGTYHLFLYLKRDFGGRRFDSGYLHQRHLTIKRAQKNWFSAMTEKWWQMYRKIV